MRTCEKCTQTIPLEDDDEFIWSDGIWTARTRGELPGWINLQANRHVEGFWSLNEAEAATFGKALRLAGRLAKEASQAERVYIYWMGEDHIHFQVHIAPRAPESEPQGEALHMMMMPIARFERWGHFFDPVKTKRMGASMRTRAAEILMERDI